MKRENKIIFGLAGLCGVCGLAGLLYLNEMKRSCVDREIRRKNMDYIYDIPNCNVTPETAAKFRESQKTGNSNVNDHATYKPGNKTMSQREVDALTNHIKAMTNEELEVVVQAIPTSMCMWRIQKALDHSAEFETMIKKAYEMRQ